MESGAIISRCGRYRYRLWRMWGPGHSILWVMLNPSTADGLEDDATIRRCIAFSLAWGYQRLDVVNLFALRATSPKELKTARDPIGPCNNQVIRSMVQYGYQDLFPPNRIVVAWGNRGELFNRDQEVLALLPEKVACLGVTKIGQPKHPLYLSKAVESILFSPRQRERAHE